MGRRKPNRLPISPWILRTKPLSCVLQQRFGIPHVVYSNFSKALNSPTRKKRKTSPRKLRISFMKPIPLGRRRSCKSSNCEDRRSQNPNSPRKHQLRRCLKSSQLQHTKRHKCMSQMSKRLLRQEANLSEKVCLS